MEKTHVFLKDNEQYVQLSLLHLGALKWNKGAQRLNLALLYVIEHKVITDQHVMCLYEFLAHSQKCTWRVIERSLRYAIQKLRAYDPICCSKLFYRSGNKVQCPTESEFFSVYVAAFQKGVIQEWVDSLEEQEPLDIITNKND